MSAIADLSRLGLSVEQVAKRRHSIGGSDANTIMSGNAEWIMALWRKKAGLDAPDDLSGVLRVVMGQHTESLNRAWFMKTVGGRIDRDGHEVADDVEPWRTCTLDGIVSGVKILPDAEGVFEAKHVSGKKPFADVLAHYMPQLQHNMAVTGLTYAVLSVFLGTETHEWALVEADEAYQARLLDAERAFWASVQAGEPPHIPAPAPKPARVVDMRGSNAWGVAAADYLETASAAKRHESAKRSLKDLMPEDAVRAHGMGIEIKRASNGNLTIKESKE